MTEQDNEATTATAEAHAMDEGAQDGGFEMIGGGLDLAALLGGMGREPEVPPLDPAEARGILRGAFERLTKEHDFTEGDFIRRKPGFYTGTADLRGGVAVFVRYAVPESHTHQPPALGVPVPVVDEDCIIAIVIPTGEVAEYFATSRYYEPAPAVEAVA